jgi:hypothetical protein
MRELGRTKLGAGLLTGLIGLAVLRLAACRDPEGPTSPAFSDSPYSSGAATRIARNAGNNQSATVNTAVATRPAVKVTDAGGSPVEGVAVIFAVASGAGSITGASQTTNARGIARVASWTLGKKTGSNTLTATSTGLTGSPVTFTATGTPGAPASIVIVEGNNVTAPAGTAVRPRPRVKVRDAFGNGVPNVTITFAVTSGGGSITGATQLTGPAGAAGVGSWTLGPTSGTNTLTATASGTGIASNPLTFTATASPSPEVVFIGAGDIAGCKSTFKDAETAALIQQYPAATVFALGDNAYSDGTPIQYSSCYEPTWGAFKNRTRPTPGNHDYHVAGAQGYFSYFGALAGPSNLGYYSYDLGEWHIISLNSEISAGATSAQATWLKKDLTDHPARCILAYWHRPVFSSGRHPNDPRMNAIFTILYNAGADVVLSGHNHAYERFGPQRPDATPDAALGIREFVVGTGGSAALYDFDIVQPNSEIRYNGWGVLKLILKASSYSWEFLSIAGSTFTDTGSGECH